MTNEEQSLLQAALLGYQQQLADIEAKIAEVKRRLGGKKTPAAATSAKKHHISAEGRARIAEAQRKRWAAAKKAER